MKQPDSSIQIIGSPHNRGLSMISYMPQEILDNIRAEHFRECERQIHAYLQDSLHNVETLRPGELPQPTPSLDTKIQQKSPVIGFVQTVP